MVEPTNAGWKREWEAGAYASLVAQSTDGRPRSLRVVASIDTTSGSRCIRPLQQQPSAATACGSWAEIDAASPVVSPSRVGSPSIIDLAAEQQAGAAIAAARQRGQAPAAAVSPVAVANREAQQPDAESNDV